MEAVLIDSNILIDLFEKESAWFDWSAGQVRKLSHTHRMVINPIIYGEIAYPFDAMEMLDTTLRTAGIERLPLPFEAAWHASQCHRKYRAQGGMRAATLPDFFIGAHAVVDGLTLLTRDRGRYVSYFPTIDLICP